MTTRQHTLALVKSQAPSRIKVKNHTYSTDGKSWLPGVTGILRIQDALGGSDGLVRWAVKLAAQAAFDEARRSEHPEFDSALMAAIAATEEPRNRGSRVHEGIDAAHTGTAHVPNPSDGPIWYAFTQALIRERIVINASEQFVIGESWGGTLDLDATVDGRRALIDVKTGKYKPDFALQLAGYSACQWMAPKPTGTPVVPVPEFEAFYVLMLSDTRYELIEEKVGQAERDHFAFLAQTHAKLREWAARGNV